MFLSKLFKLNKDVVVKVYHGYGDEDGMLLLGHVFKKSPLPPKYDKNSIRRNIKGLIKLFLAVPHKSADVTLELEGQQVSTNTDDNGFFKLEWKSNKYLQTGWQEVVLQVQTVEGVRVKGEGKVLVPHESEYTYISDIDDTFLVSHSSNLLKRLYELFTKNAQTRKPFNDVVRHYQLLANATNNAVQNPFFYVSSSEWNLYEYIKEFCRMHQLPEGVFLLSPLKRWYELLQTGQGKHETKYDRIVRIIKAFPKRKYVLLGDDTQKDPEIYLNVVRDHTENIKCVYLRQVRKSNMAATKVVVAKLKQYGVEVYYYKNSADAIGHSKRVGLVT